MNVNDWHECTHWPYPMFSANGVPWPLDEWLRVQGKMTTTQAAYLIKRWPEGNKNGRYQYVCVFLGMFCICNNHIIQ